MKLMMEDTEDDVAVIGMGCNFPGGEGLDHFWRVLLEGKNCVVDIPAERFDATFWYDADVSKPGKMLTAKAALIEGMNEFDHKFFGITEAEVDFMDPQQKLLLHCTYRALEDAGISMESISGSRTGVYIGLMNRDYEMLRNDSPSTFTHYNGTGTAMSVAANRISFIFNFTGPSLAIDSACSSSLVALHVACQAIKQGDCEMALCGGVNCIIEPRVFVALSKAMMISPEGTSKPFSIRADGYGRGEGCGVVLLKPLKHAIKDHNKIWGIVSKTAVNQDGRSVTPITKPSMIQQEELLRQIYSDTDIANVQYIEAHGTGTPVGDPTEAGSISNVIAKARPPDSGLLLMGSLKGNIGHTESAAGVAGLIKVLLMMKHKTFVPSVFYSEDSASIDVKALNLKIPAKAESWESNGPLGRVGGVNSFGFGGTNAHVILKEYIQTLDPINLWPKIFVLSAASEKSMILTITDTHQRLCSTEAVDLQALSYTSACRRSHCKHKYRKAFPTFSLSDLKHQLTSAARRKVESARSDVQVVFVFCGNGVSYRGMCRQLMKDALVFREKVREVEKIFQSYEDISISQWLAGESSDGDVSQPHVVQSLLLAVQVGISTLLKSWGVKPDTVLGHSVGEVAAAHCSGLLSLEDAVKVCFHRSILQLKVTGGKMLVVSNVAVEKVFQILSLFSGKINVAAVNSPQSCTLSGDADTIDTFHEKLKLLPDKNLFLHHLDVPAAYHSHMMDPVLEDIERSIGHLDRNDMECKLFSTVTGEECSHDDFSSGRYWAKNVRQPVLFEQALRAAVKDKQPGRNVVFVEIGPRRALQRYIQESLGNEVTVLTSVHPEKDCDTISSTVAKLFELGIDVDWNEVYRGCETLPTALPLYQFDSVKKDVRFEALRKDSGSSTFSHHALIAQTEQGNKEFVCNISLETTPYLWEHKNNSIAIVPGAFYVELAYAAVMASLQPKKPVSQLCISVAFESVLTLSSSCHQLKVTVDHSDQHASFKVQSSAATLASGTCICTDQQQLLEEAAVCLDVIFQRCSLVMTRREIYSALSHAGFEYGPLFKQLDDVRLGNEFKEAVTTFQVPSDILRYLHEYFLHPVLLDYFMQMTAVVAVTQFAGKQGFPSGITAMTIAGPPQEEMVIYMRVTKESSDFLEVCGCFATTEGKVLVELKGVRISFLDCCSNVQLPFFHNETYAIAKERDLQDYQLKAIVFEDKLGIAKRLRPYISPESVIVESTEKMIADQVQNLVFNSLSHKEDLEHVLFICGVEDLSHLSSEKMLDRLVTCCETFRWIVLAVKASRRSVAIRVITYRSAEMTVDHLSPGFVLSGLMRACAAEMPGLCFQLIDLASVTCEDIQMLVHVVKTCPQQEVRVSKGQALATKIARTPVRDEDLCDDDTHTVHPGGFVLQTSDPYRVAHLSATPADPDINPLQMKSVEIQLTNVCVHSSDFFPVSTSHLTYGRTLYWTKHASQNHELLAVDFSGIVTAAGANVKTIKVGDNVAACYPVTASAKIVIPEAACYSTETLPFLRDTPCVSYFILAWEILQRRLPDVKNQHRKLVFISSDSASALIKVLALTASRSGWNVSSHPHFTRELPHFDAAVFLPPFDPSCQELYNSGGLEKHAVFVCSSYMSSTVSASLFAFNNEHICVHKLDVASVLHRANLQAQNRDICSWLMSLGFDASSLPLRGELYQLKESESYFTTKTVQQVILDHGGLDCAPLDIPLLPAPRQLFKQTCVYIVTGGISGLGFETVKFIAHNGGGCIATLSRSFPSDETQLEMNLLQKRCKVAIANIQCDVSVSTQVVNAISQIEKRFPASSIKGVFHSAAVLHDALIESLDESLFRKVLQPKVCGALNLHFATLQRELDFFVCYSSISSFIGNASQCNYAAANSFLDAFCHFRRNLGLAGQSINWGPLNLGLLLNKNHFQQFLEAKGMMIMGVREVHHLLKKCLLMNRPQQVICRFFFQKLKIHVLSQNASLRERLSGLVEAELKDETHAEANVQHLTASHESVRMIVSDILNVSPVELDEDSPLCALGIDSMLAMTLQNRIFQETGVNVPLVLLLDPNITIADLENVVLNSG